MKKFFAMAVMALTVAFMASCGAGNSGKYTQGGPEPQIDYNAGTVNGKAYDNRTDCCWKLTTSYYYIVNVSASEYVWGTEFAVVAAGELTMYEFAQLGYGNASYSYSVTSDQTYEACDKHNEQ